MGLGDFGAEAESLMTQFFQESQAHAELAQEIARTDPSIGFVNAFILAGDRLSAIRASALLEAGILDLEKAFSSIGSYSRLEWGLKNVPREDLIKRLPALWAWSDPDDTNPDLARLWVSAWKANKQKMLRDSDSKLPCKNGRVTLWRGQRKGQSVGISWTADEAIARKFSRCGGLRLNIPDGILLQGSFPTRAVMAYLTGRKESEVVINPYHLEKLAWMSEDGESVEAGPFAWEKGAACPI